MRFEHLVEINDLNNPLTFNLGRTQLWAGLMARVEDSRPFLPGMDECLILEREAALVRRLLRFGAVEIRDTVTFVEEEWVCFTTEPSAQHAGGTLTIRIEAPRADLPEQLFLRFTYATSLAESGDPEDRAYAKYIEAAYHASDMDTVQEIRRLAESERAH